MPQSATRQSVKRPYRDYDSVVKHVFEIGSPSILTTLAGGEPVVEFLNVELPVVMKRVADLLMRLANGALLHLDFQSVNDRHMAYREGIVALLIGRKFGHATRLRQVVLYMGEEPLRMPKSAKIAGVTVEYDLMDIRDFDADTLLATGNPADCALALLARGGKDRIRQILLQAGSFQGAARQRVLEQISVLSGLRRLSEELKMEMKRMGLAIDVEKNAILREIREQGLEEGLERGIVKGRAEGRVEEFETLLRLRFGRLSSSATGRLKTATPKQLDRWRARLFTARTIDEVFGTR